MNTPMDNPTTCYHGGAFWEGIGADFASLEQYSTIVPADVLDAWFPPAPGVVQALRDELPFLLQTSPPTDCEGLIAAIATARGVPDASVVVGAGSSDLIFRAFLHWLSPASRVLLLDPTYGEYAHVLENVVGCRVDRLRLHRDEDYRLDLERLIAMASATLYDLIVLVNPNNPTGDFLSRLQLEAALDRIPTQTRVWIDEAYLDYVGGPHASTEEYAAASLNVIVCKSLSKGFALSGARVAYLVAPFAMVRELRRLTPPWAVGLPAQVAAVRAFAEPNYYRVQYAKTGCLRNDLAKRLRQIDAFTDIPILLSPANWLLCELPHSGPDARTVVQRCRRQGVYLRAASAGTGQALSAWSLRIAVRSSPENARVVAALKGAITEGGGGITIS